MRPPAANDQTSMAVEHVAVVGGGIAAFAAARALRTAGFRVLALKGTEPPVAPERLLVCPRLQRGDHPHARFLREAYREACAFYEQPPHNKAIVARGALRLAQSAQEQTRGQALAQELPRLCRWLSAQEAQQKSGLLKDATRWGGCLLPHALVLAPRQLFGRREVSLESSSAKSETSLNIRITRIAQEEDGGWRLFSETQKQKARKEGGEQKAFKTDAVVLALGAALPMFLRESVFLPSSPPWSSLLQNLCASLQTGRGRLDICDRAALSCPPLLPVCASGWVMPYPRARIGVVRGLAPSRAELGGQENRKRLEEWCGLSEGKANFEASCEKPYEASRLSTRDRLPLLGEIPRFLGKKPSRLFLFAALGGHGFLTAPLCAQKLVRLLQVHDVHDAHDHDAHDAHNHDAPDVVDALSVPAEPTLLSPQRFFS